MDTDTKSRFSDMLLDDRYNEVLAESLLLIEANGANSEAYFYASTAAMCLEDYESSMRFGQKALELDELNPGYFAHLSGVYIQAGNARLGLEYVRKGLELVNVVLSTDKHKPRAMQHFKNLSVNRWKALIALERYDDALAQAILNQDFLYPNIRNIRTSLVALDRLEDAENVYVNPDCRDYGYNLGGIAEDLIYCGQYELATEYYRRRLTFFVVTEYNPPLFQYIVSLCLAKHWNEAHHLCLYWLSTGKIRKKADRTMLHLLLAICWEKLDKSDEAADVMKTNILSLLKLNVAGWLNGQPYEPLINLARSLYQKYLNVKLREKRVIAGEILIGSTPFKMQK